MTTVESRPLAGPELIDELRAFLEDNWDPDLTVGDWWERLGTAGWAAPMLPADCYGRGVSRADAMAIGATILRHGALPAPIGMSVSMAAPTIATHGTREQIERLIPPAVTGKVHYCQLFSEPGAGSDLAGLNTRAVRDGDIWHVNGQKVWTSGGQNADLGMLIARTAPDAPKHQGITWFSFNMHQPGVEVRPLKEMTGHAVFNEVFMTDAEVNDDDRIGDANNGWAVTNTTLFHERSGMASRGGAAGGGTTRIARAGGVVGDLDKRAGEFIGETRKIVAVTDAPAKKKPSPAQAHIDLARDLNKTTDPNVRQRIAYAHTLGTLADLNGERQKALRATGRDLPGLPNFGKMLMAHIVRLNRDLGMEILGARGMLHAYDDDGQAALAELPGGTGATNATATALRAQGLPIFGGTDQIQRNIVGERILGLPKEPGDMSKLPFNELPTNG